MHGREWIAKGAARTREARILAALRTKMLIGAAYAAVTAKTNQKIYTNIYKIRAERRKGKSFHYLPICGSWHIHCRPFGTPVQVRVQQMHGKLYRT